MSRTDASFVQILPVIPKILHFIWVGNDLPETYQQNILTWQKLNLDYTIKVWSTRLGMKKDSSYDAIQHFCEHNNIDLMDLDKMDLFLMNIAREILTQETYSWRFACVSDVLRISILLKYGGFYLDTDLRAIKPLNTVSAPYAFLYYLKSMNRGERESYTNDIQAAIPGHPLYAMAAYIVQKNYTSYGIGDGCVGHQMVEHQMWKGSNNLTEISSGVICSFGLVVKDAMAHLKARGDMIIHDESLARFNFLQYAELNLHEASNWRTGLWNEQQRCSMIQCYIERLRITKLLYYPILKQGEHSLRSGGKKVLLEVKSPQFLSITISIENAFKACYKSIKVMILNHEFDTFMNGFFLFSNSTKIAGNKNITRVAYDLYMHINRVLEMGCFNIENEKVAIMQFLVRLDESRVIRLESTKEFYKKISDGLNDFYIKST